MKKYASFFILLFLLNETYAQTSISSDIYWSFDEAGGTTVYDGRRNKPMGIVVCSDRADKKNSSFRKPGFLGGALLCGGPKQYGFYMETEQKKTIKGPFTLSVWIKPNRDQWSTRIFYYKPHWLSRSGFELQINGLKTSLVTCLDGDQKSIVHIPMEIGPQTGFWSFVTVVWDGKLWRLYLNGLCVGTSRENKFPAYIPPPNGTKLIIGGYTRRTNNTFCGLLDEVKFWNRPLSSKEIEHVLLDDLKKHHIE